MTYEGQPRVRTLRDDGRFFFNKTTGKYFLLSYQLCIDGSNFQVILILIDYRFFL